MKIRLNVVFHSKTNDQTKRQNKTLKQYFRCYVNYQQNDWTKWLSVVEYVYNNSWYNIIKINLFTIIFDESFKWEQYQENDEVEVSTTSLRIDYSEFLRKILYKRLKNARSDQAKYFDKKHILKSFNVRDKVLTNSKNIKTNKSSKKLNHKYLKSFEVKLSIDKQMYRFRLFKSLDLFTMCFTCLF
jgi:hypothetical protein